MFDVQLMGGIVLHEGDIAEMKTGEGKTFVASLALYLNGLAGRGAHLVTVNDYLAQRDAEWNRPVFESLGMSVASIETMMPFDQRRRRTTPTSRTGRTPSSASTTSATTWRSASTASSSAATLTRSSTRSTRSSIDEARTPLIISGEPETAAQIYYDFARVARQLDRRSARRPATRRARPRTRRRLRVRREVQDGRRDAAGRRRRSSARSGSTTSTRPRTRSSSTTSSRRSRPSRSTTSTSTT